MEFELNDFTKRLRELMYDRFPNLPNRGINPSGTPKHGQHNEEIRNVAFKNNPTYMLDENSNGFEIGNEFSEEYYPYYHILEDAPYIRKRNKSTKKTRGSQASVEKLGERDYNIISFNGKTYSREYARNVRGARNRTEKVSHLGVDASGKKVWINRESNSYLNEHYHYIENMLNGGILDQIAQEYGLRRQRTVNTSLQEDYEALSLVDIINSTLEE